MKKIAVFFNNVWDNTIKGFNLRRFLGILLNSSVFILLLWISLFNASGVRYIFLYPNLDASKTKLEVRYLTSNESKEEKIALFISEFLLGPIRPDLNPLFKTSTLLQSCMLRGKDLYVSLSEEALSSYSDSLDYKRTYELFKKNVCTNFKNIGKIYVYVDGIAIFEDKTLVSESN